MIHSRIDAATFWLVAQSLDKLGHHVPHNIYIYWSGRPQRAPFCDFRLKFSFISRTIKNWNQLSAEALETSIVNLKFLERELGKQL